MDAPCATTHDLMSTDEVLHVSYFSMKKKQVVGEQINQISL